MQQPERVPAGWYPDPLASAQVRWWDSHGWTDHTQDFGGPARASETIVVTPLLEWAEPEEPGAHEPKLADVANQLAKMAAPKSAADAVGAASSAPTARRAGRDDYVEAANGWLAVNFAVTTAWNNSIIRVTSDEIPELIIDCEQGLYWCEVGVDALPRTIKELTVNMKTKLQASAPTHAGRDLEGLLWMLAAEIDAGGPIQAVDPKSRFTLNRWPRVISTQQSSDHARMTTMLAHAYLTPAELATRSNSNIFQATRLIAAYRMMGLLTELSEGTTPNAGNGSGKAPSGKITRRLWETLKK